MGKKKGTKKGGGDDYWDEAGESIEQGDGNLDDGNAKLTSNENAFAAMSIEDTPGDVTSAQSGKSISRVDGADDDEYGGLMGTIKKNNAKGKKGKKGKKQRQDDDIWDELGEDVSGNAMVSNEKEDAEVDVGVDEERQNPQHARNENEGKLEKTEPDATKIQPTEEDSGRLLTKKEKERLKKEREKAKKREQAAAKKTQESNNENSHPIEKPEDIPETTNVPNTAQGEDEEGEEEGDVGGTSAADKKKKKKKKKGAETKAEPAPQTTKKPSAALQALQARIAAQRKAEEEAQREEEEARRQEEEAERLEKEEADRKEAERQRRREKEKAKREQLRKEGKLLTPKQKAEKAAAEARMQAMISSGAVKVDGLTNRERPIADGEEKKGRPMYDKKKKKGPSGPANKLTPVSSPPAANGEHEKSVVATKEDTSESIATEKPADVVVEAKEDSKDDGIKDDWDADSDTADIKDEWDAESEDEKAKDVKEEQDKAAKAPAKTDERKGEPPTKETKNAENEESSVEDSSDEDSDESSSSEDENDLSVAQKMTVQRKMEAERRRKEKHEAALKATSKDNLRSPICCIMGHVDTGKTKLLDKIRQTNVQEGEAGGITQQIGATYFPEETLREKIAPIDPEGKQHFQVPGLLVIDTPGHESFTNLRSRGSSLCNIAILVVDIMHGLEQQTLESIRLLRDRKTPFIVALNKIDRLYGWKSTPDGAFRASLSQQDRATQNEFHDRLAKTVVAFAEQGLNAVPYYENKNFSKNVSLVPTSAHTGEGIPDMLQLLINLTQDRMSGKLMYLSELECTVLEVKVIEGLGTTIDVILSNGVMNEGDRIVLCGLNGPIVTQVRALLTPQPLKEMRVKGSYVHHKTVKAALGVKISAPDLEKAISGSRLLVVGEDDDEEDLKEEVMSDLTGLLHSIDKSGRGVCVQASTLGSLEALLEFLKQSKIPVNGINIGPVYKRDVMRCSTMLEKQPDLAVMLCFDVDIDKEAERLADELGVKIFSAKIIYHLFDAFVAHQKQVLESKQKASADTAVWPCRLKVLAVFAKRSPLILGCEVVAGDLRIGTPIAVKNKETGEITSLGRVTSLEVNHKRMDIVTPKSAGAGVAVRIECAPHETPKMYGRHFTDQDELFSLLSRQSIDTLKELFWVNVTTEQKKTIKLLKSVIGIP